MNGTWEGTVLLADVRADAAKLYAVVGPTQALEAIQRSVETLAQVARTAGGHVIRQMADEIMALFPAPAAAADAAAAMRAAVETLPIFANVKLGVRIAFHSGPVTVRDGDVLGKTVNLAEQLLKQANSEQILTSTNTAAGLQNTYRKRLRLLRPSEANRNAEEITSCELVWQVGSETTTLEVGGQNAAAGYKRQLRLKHGLSELATTQGDLPLIKLGRDLACHLSVLDELASRHHCTIERRGEEFVLRDHSTNGTFVTEEGTPEMRLQHAEAVLGSHGWLALGQPRERTDQLVEYFCE
ncbi:MAG TPA: FHA domain-containing protein [Burkholderiales bacterium]|jgi:class 3 adenylate cyclase|nr:FHA domain-containing protein [Burkholderiales bacterium]